MDIWLPTQHPHDTSPLPTNSSSISAIVGELYGQSLNYYIHDLACTKIPNPQLD